MIVEPHDDRAGAPHHVPLRIRYGSLDRGKCGVPLVKNRAIGEAEGTSPHPFKMQVALSVGFEPLRTVPLSSIGLNRDAVIDDEVLVVGQSGNPLLGAHRVADVTQAATDYRLLT